MDENNIEACMKPQLFTLTPQEASVLCLCLFYYGGGGGVFLAFPRGIGGGGNQLFNFSFAYFLALVSSILQEG